MPVVAAAHGTTAGGGLGILLCSDYAIVGAGSRIGSLYANIGLTPDLSVSAHLARAIGERRALQLVVRDKGLTRYLGTGDAGDVLLGALCRLVDPLVRARTDKQWEAIAAYRELGHQRAVAEQLGVTRQSVGDRLAAGNRRAVEEADAAIAAYLSYQRRQQSVD